MLKFLILFFALLLELFAAFDDGKKLFHAKCSSCHAGYLPMEELKENFLEKNNTLLHLKAPTVNMLSWAIVRSPKRIVVAGDSEMSQEAAMLYLQETVEDPNSANTLFPEHIHRYFSTHPRIEGLHSRDYENLTEYLLNYDLFRRQNPLKQSFLESFKQGSLGKDFQLTQVLDAAKREGKRVIVEASSPSCHYCIRMDEKVLADPEVKKILDKEFLLVRVNVQESALPASLVKHYRHITPSFFFLDENGSLLHSYPGSWTKSDFLIILNENRRAKERKQ